MMALVHVVGGDNSIIDCSGEGVAIQTSSGCNGAVIESIFIRNASTGIVHSTTASDVTVINVTISYCSFRAINVTGGGMELVSSMITNNTNTVQYGGGGVYAEGSTTQLTIIRSSFIGNKAFGNGGGLFCDSWILRVVGCVF